MRARLVASDMDIGRCDSWCATMDFKVDPVVIKYDGQFVDVARDAVKEFLTTESGKEKADELGYFDWGDAMEWVPEEIWVKHGLKPVYEPDYLIGNVNCHFYGIEERYEKH